MSYIEKTPAQASKADASTGVLYHYSVLSLYTLNYKSVRSTQFPPQHCGCYYKHLSIPSDHEPLILHLRFATPAFVESAVPFSDEPHHQYC